MLPSADIRVGMVSDRKTPLSSTIYAASHRAMMMAMGLNPDAMENQQRIMFPSIAVHLANGSVAEFFAENRRFLERLVEDKIYAEQSYTSFVNQVYQMMESNK